MGRHIIKKDLNFLIFKNGNFKFFSLQWQNIMINFRNQFLILSFYKQHKSRNCGTEIKVHYPNKLWSTDTNTTNNEQTSEHLTANNMYK